MPCQVLSPAFTEDDLREVLFSTLESDTRRDIAQVNFHVLIGRILSCQHDMNFAMPPSPQQTGDHIAQRIRSTLIPAQLNRA